MELIHYILLVVIVMLGGWLGRVAGIEKGRGYLDAFLVFSAAFLLGIVAIHMIPMLGKSSSAFIGLWILLGFIIQLLLEQLTQGVEHGHVHFHGHSRSFAFQILLGLGIHALLEGIPLPYYSELAAGHVHAHHLTADFNHLLWGVIAHKLPAAFTLGILFLYAGFKGVKYYGLIFIFAICTPIGAMISEVFTLSDEMRLSLVALVVGSMLHISTTIIFEIDKENEHRLSYKKILAVVLGMGIAILSVL